MRAVLISLAGPSPAVAGRSLALRQLDFALAAGCSRVFALGNGASGEALALRHAAEGAGARFIAIGDGHALLGALPATDELLVLAPALLPEAADGLAALGAGAGIAVLPADPAVPAGFERIDKDRAWAGALVMPGAAVERLAQLDPASDPVSALLRIALQAGVPERRLDPAILAGGGWTLLRPGTDLAALDRAWLARNLSVAGHDPPSGRLASAILSRWGLPLLSAGRAVGAATALLPLGALALAALGWPAAGLALLVPATVTAGLAAGLRRLAAAPFGRRGRAGWERFAPVWIDLALAGSAALGIAGDAPHRLFPPLVLALLLNARGPDEQAEPRGWLGDRALLALAFAGAAAFGYLEPAVMLAALGLIAARVPLTPAPPRITPD